MKGKDFTGIKFWNLTAVRRSDRQTKSQSWLWVFRCDCGNEITAVVQDVKRGHTKSCGCLKVKTGSEINLKHGMEDTRIYRIWGNMKQRCLNQNNPAYKNYGERGITVCSEWNEFENFYKWAINNGYKDDLTIDRRDNNRGYSPDNCRWATYKQQQNNRGNVHSYEVHGKFYTAEELSKLTDVSIYVIKNRKHRNQPLLTKDEYYLLCDRLEKAGGES